MIVARSAVVCCLVLLCACTEAPGTDGGAPGTDAGPVKFTMGTDNFPFENYTNTAGIVNLTEVEMVRLFGDAVCAAPDAGTCTLTPSAANFMQGTNAAMNGGHCEGMAVLSVFFATGQAKPSDFGAATGNALTLVGNEKLQREIAFWWATQSTNPTKAADSRGVLSPNEVLALVERSFTVGGESYAFGMYKRDGSGGHANTPYLVREVDAGIKEVLVYENNFPTAVTGVTINTIANTWSYSATPNPTTPAELYEGDATTKSLTVTPNSARMQVQVCPTCGSVTADGRGVKGNAVSFRTVRLQGDAQLRIADGLGNTIALDGGSYVSTIPGATLIAGKSAPSTWDDREVPAFQLPLTMPLTVTLDGVGMTAATQAAVRLTAPGYTFAVEGVELDPGQVDTIVFSAGADSVSYTTSGVETPIVELGMTLDGNDYQFEVASGSEANGVTVELHTDVPGQRLGVKINSRDGMASYGVRVHVLNAGDVVFAHQGNTISATAIVWLEYGTWAGDGAPMTVSIDDDGDGTIDQTVMLTDDGN